MKKSLYLHYSKYTLLMEIIWANVKNMMIMNERKRKKGINNMNNPKKIIVPALILIIVGFLLLIQTKKENLKTFTGPVTLEYLREIDLSYTEILAQVESPDKKLVVSFAIRNEGNRNA